MVKHARRNDQLKEVKAEKNKTEKSDIQIINFSKKNGTIFDNQN